MHPQALDWIARQSEQLDPDRILDVGGRDINGSPREMFPADADYVVVDLIDHPSVDVIGGILDFDADDLGGEFDCIIYAEVAEHSCEWRDHIDHLFDLLVPGGTLIITAANLTRLPHSALDGGPIRDAEHYENIDPDELRDLLYEHTSLASVDVLKADVRAVAVKELD